MFDSIKVGVAAAIGGVMLALLALSGGAAWYFHAEYVKDETELVILRQVNKDQKASLELAAKSATISDKTCSNVMGKTDALDKKVSTINKTVDGRVNEIMKKYDGLAANADNQKNKSQEIGLEHVRGMWLTFCLAKPDDTRCTEQTGAPAPERGASAPILTPPVAKKK
jgi:hypothetical protein